MRDYKIHMYKGTLRSLAEIARMEKVCQHSLKHYYLHMNHPIDEALGMIEKFVEKNKKVRI